MQTKFDDEGQFIEPRLKRYAIHVNSVPVIRYEGFDLTVEDILRRRNEIFEKAYKEQKPHSRDGLFSSSFADSYGDEVLWLDDKVVAVIRPTTEHGHARLRFWRFDKTTWPLGPRERFEPAREWMPNAVEDEDARAAKRAARAKGKAKEPTDDKPVRLVGKRAPQTVGATS
jgi:hypothetical protein